MHLIIAAVAAVAAALAEFTLAPYLAISGAVPHIVLVLGIVWAIVAGLEAGLVWAFVGGLALDSLVGRPLGSSAFALLLVLGLAATIGGASGRARPLAPIAAAFICSLGYSMLLLVTSVTLQGPVALPDPIGAFLPSAVYDTALAALIGPLAIAVQLRRRAAERVEW